MEGINKMNLYEKIATIRVELQNTQLKKSGKNEYAKFQYFELADFLPAIQELEKKNKVLSIFNFESDKAVLLIIDAENPNSIITFETPTAKAEIKGTTEIQQIGGANTYLKRYLYTNAYGITETDMLDRMCGSDKVVNTKAKKELSIKEELAKYAAEKKLSTKEIGERFNISKETTDEEYKRALETLKKENGEV